MWSPASHQTFQPGIKQDVHDRAAITIITTCKISNAVSAESLPSEVEFWGVRVDLRGQISLFFLGKQISDVLGAPAGVGGRMIKSRPGTSPNREECRGFRLLRRATGSGGRREEVAALRQRTFGGFLHAGVALFAWRNADQILASTLNQNSCVV